MAKLPSPQDLARELIAALVRYGCRPGDGVPIQSARTSSAVIAPPRTSSLRSSRLSQMAG